MVGLQNLWQMKPELPESAIIDLIFLVHDVLNDDDEDVRQAGSTVAHEMLSSFSPGALVVGPLVAHEACRELRKFLTLHYHESRKVLAQAMKRLIGFGGNLCLSWRKLDRDLLDTLEGETILFVVEKQNLYIDEVVQVEAWAGVLKSLSFQALHPLTVRKLFQWCSEGLDTMLETTHKQRDGPLGWTSKSEVFIAGMRLINCADVILHWRTEGKLRDSSRFEIAEKLRMWYEISQQNQLHGLWTRGMEGILKSVSS